MNTWLEAILIALVCLIFLTGFIFIYSDRFEFGWLCLIATFLAISIIYAAASNLMIKKVIAMYYGYQSLSLLYDKIVIKEIQRWVMNNSVPTKRLTNIYLPHVQTLLEEHKKASLIERFKSQWGKIFLLPSTLFIVFSFIFQLPGAEDASSNELLYVGFLILMIGVMVLVIIGFVTFGILSFSVPDFDRRFHARLELALTIAAYR
ncbi:hypothetical protein [uncultured Marinococcus sp.]|uniref:hypothetical protein n=1 Tax=uncultured Marinococcus sp. TaxID=487012 RepID=UPI0026205C08|nr:hypothetical protein [uncultured Marinococcus sp.]